MAKTTTALKTFRIVQDMGFGIEFEKFTFHANSQESADDKAYGWERYHSLTRGSVSARPATQEEINNASLLHNEWVR